MIRDDLTLSEQVVKAEEEYYDRFMLTGGRLDPGTDRELAEMCDHIARLHEEAVDYFRRRAESYRTKTR